MDTYGGGLFGPIPGADWRALAVQFYRQFGVPMATGPARKTWANARSNMQTRRDVERERNVFR